MEFKKCARCGCFYMSDDDICINCVPQDKVELSKFNHYVEENLSSSDSIDTISAETGISVKNLNRYLSGQKLADYAENLANNAGDSHTIHINL